jgi:hypothetical protein
MPTVTRQSAQRPNRSAPFDRRSGKTDTKVSTDTLVLSIGLGGPAFIAIKPFPAGYAEQYVDECHKSRRLQRILT